MTVVSVFNAYTNKVLIWFIPFIFVLKHDDKHAHTIQFLSRLEEPVPILEEKVTWDLREAFRIHIMSSIMI